MQYVEIALNCTCGHTTVAKRASGDKYAIACNRCGKAWEGKTDEFEVRPYLLQHAKNRQLGRLYD